MLYELGYPVAVVVAVWAAHDAWRRWLVHREAKYAEQIAELDARATAFHARLADVEGKLRKLSDQVNGLVLKQSTRR